MTVHCVGQVRLILLIVLALVELRLLNNENTLLRLVLAVNILALFIYKILNNYILGALYYFTVEVYNEVDNFSFMATVGDKVQFSDGTENRSFRAVGTEHSV